MDRPLSLCRRFLVDRIEAARSVPLRRVYRTMLLSPLALERAALHPHPGWSGLLARAFARIAAERPELRRALIPRPRARIYEHPVSIAAVGLVRTVGDETGLLFTRLRQPEARSPLEIDRYLRRCQHGPLERVPLFRRALGLSCWPVPFRRLLWWWTSSVSGPRRARHLGTFAVGPDGPALIAPLSFTLGHGPLQIDGSMEVVFTFDPRVLTPDSAARTLNEMERELNGPLRAELRCPANPPSGVHPV